MWQDMNLHTRLQEMSLDLSMQEKLGAINEALSDILGVAVEKYANNGKFN